MINNNNFVWAISNVVADQYNIGFIKMGEYTDIHPLHIVIIDNNDIHTFPSYRVDTVIDHITYSSFIINEDNIVCHNNPTYMSIFTKYKNGYIGCHFYDNSTYIKLQLFDKDLEKRKYSVISFTLGLLLNQLTNFLYNNGLKYKDIPKNLTKFTSYIEAHMVFRSFFKRN